MCKFANNDFSQYNDLTFYLGEIFMAILLLFLMFVNGHGATADYSDADLWQQAQQAINPYRPKIQAILNPPNYLQITTLGECVDFIRPIQYILHRHLPYYSLGSEIGFCLSDDRLNPSLFYNAFNKLIASLPARNRGFIWTAKEVELEKDPRNLNVFTSAFKLLIEALHLFCDQKQESAQEKYRLFCGKLSKDTFWQLAQKSIDRYRAPILALLNPKSYNSMRHFDEFIHFTTPIVELLKDAAHNSRYYLCQGAFLNRLECKRTDLDPPLFLQALERIKRLTKIWAIDVIGEGVAVLDRKMLEKKVTEAFQLLLRSLLDFCNEDEKGATQNHDEFLKISLNPEDYIVHESVVRIAIIKPCSKIV